MVTEEAFKNFTEQDSVALSYVYFPYKCLLGALF